MTFLPATLTHVFSSVNRPNSRGAVSMERRLWFFCSNFRSKFQWGFLPPKSFKSSSSNLNLNCRFWEFVRFLTPSSWRLASKAAWTSHCEAFKICCEIFLNSLDLSQKQSHFPLLPLLAWIFLNRFLFLTSSDFQILSSNSVCLQGFFIFRFFVLSFHPLFYFKQFNNTAQCEMLFLSLLCRHFISNLSEV